MSNYYSSDVLGAIASIVTAELLQNSISIGDADDSRIVHASLEEKGAIILRIDDGSAWVLRTVRLGASMTFHGSEDERNVQRSYANYKGLIDSMNHAMQYAKALGIEDGDLALQVWHDEVLNDEERNTLARWNPNGYASDAEWGIATNKKR